MQKYYIPVFGILALDGAMAPRIAFKEAEERPLAGVHLEGFDLALHALRADLDARADRRECDRRSLRKHEVRRAIVELLRAPRLQAVFQLLGKAGGPRSPLKSHGRVDPRHGVIRMRGQRPFGTEGHNHLRLELAHAPRQVPANLIEALLIQAAVGVVEHEAASGVQMLASGGKFPVVISSQIHV